jgi:hypothetical protein
MQPAEVNMMETANSRAENLDPANIPRLTIQSRFTNVGIR